jgi:cytochrome P450
VHSLLYHSKAEGNSSDYQNEELIQQIIIFTAAGSDLTSSLFSMMLLMISDHSEVERRLREEINASFKTKEDFSFDKLKKLEFIDWIQL